MNRKILVKKRVIKREKGFLYFIDSHGDLYKVKAKVGSNKKVYRYPKESYHHLQNHKRYQKLKRKNE